MTVLNSRTRGPAPMLIGNLNEEASSDEFGESGNGELYRLEIRNGKKVFTKSRHDSNKGNTKGGGKSKSDKACFCGGRVGHSRADCRAKIYVNEKKPNSAPRVKGVGKCDGEEQDISQNVPLG